MSSIEGFRPGWASAPGETILDILTERNLSVVGFAELIGYGGEEVNDLIEGRSTITITVARRLTELLGASVEFWMSRDFQYREKAGRLYGREEEWLRELPLGDMIKFGWLTPTPSPSEELAVCLRFFDVSSVEEWVDVYKSLQELVAFRTSPSFDNRPASVAAWLRQGEIEAEPMECKPWDSERFHKSFSEIRALTRQKDPNRFLPQLRKVCSESGVAVVIVRAPTGCRASGATRFVSPSKAVLQLSFRFLTDDHFWFTFFHEAGHLLLHGERNFFSAVLERDAGWILEGLDAPDTAEEEEANHFAAHTLVPPEWEPKLLAIQPETREVIKLAARLGVSPGIVVGQLQKRGVVGYDRLNLLKRRFAWED